MALQDFVNRVVKNRKHRSKWARKNEVFAYRIYDRDIPEYPLSVDIYEDWLYISVFYKSFMGDYEQRGQWASQLAEALSEALCIGQNLIVIKWRDIQSGSSQYQKLGNSSNRFICREGQYKFWVNLHDYLDTGLFLDHRITRKWVLQDSKGRQVLNLFAYTGSFSIYADIGQAAHVTTIDMSSTYLRWFKDNIRLNNLDITRHTIIRADVLQWIYDFSGHQFDLIILDPPTFSNSKRMKGVWDLQKDHPEILHRVFDLLSNGGKLYFSNNMKNFKLFENKLPFRTWKEITRQTIPPDFCQRQPHRCWVFEK